VYGERESIERSEAAARRQSSSLLVRRQQRRRPTTDNRDCRLLFWTPRRYGSNLSFVHLEGLVHVRENGNTLKDHTRWRWLILCNAVGIIVSVR